MTLDEEIAKLDLIASDAFEGGDANEFKQLAEWLRELQRWREFADWLVKAILEEDWEEDAGFNAEVICRKLTRLGKLKVVDNKYMEVNADEDSDRFNRKGTEEAVGDGRC